MRRLWLAGVVVVMFTQLVFSGYGRLNIVALGLMGLVAATGVSTRRTIKAFTIIGVAPALLIFTVMRERFFEETYGIASEGPGSVVTPLRDFANLVRLAESHGFQLGHGDSFVAAAAFWVPRSFWSEKPQGLGAVLTGILQPDMVGTGHSVAALNQGEWYYDFGWTGVAIMVPVVGVFLRWLDSRLAATISRGIGSRRQLLLFLLIVTVVSDVPNLMWVGSYGYVSRVALRALPLVLLLLLIARGEKGTPVRPSRRRDANSSQDSSRAPEA